jgi:DNA-binding SARP family transcriptional activator/TolB-like protein
MAKLSSVTLSLLGTFAIEANVGRPIAIMVRSKKARALLAYLAMKEDHQARREELATLFWGDNPDTMARHSLRQCLISLRRDLCVASEILITDRESIALNAQLLSVDARRFMSLAGSGRPDELAQAAALWRGVFLPEPPLDIEEFDAWHHREADRLAAAAAGVFDTLCRNAIADGEGGRAMLAAERLVELDPAREDWQRTALLLCAQYASRETALARAKAFTDWLRTELSVAPEPATRALIGRIERGDFEPAQRSLRVLPDTLTPETLTPVIVSAAEAAEPSEAAAPSLAPAETDAASSHAHDVPAELRSSAVASGILRFWHRERPAAVWAQTAMLLIAAVAVAGLIGSRFWPPRTGTPLNQGVAVLPFAADDPARSDDPAFARLLTHDLIGYLSRFGELRVISEPASEYYGHRPINANLADLGVQYAIVGHVQGSDSDLKVDFQLVDTATRVNVWSDNLRRQRGDQTLIADEAARGIARAMAIEIYRRTAIAMRAKSNSELTIGQLIGRGYLALARGTTRESLSDAMTSFDEALRRNPHYLPALLAVARVQILAVTNFIDLGPTPDLKATEQVLNAALDKFPNSISALYSLAILQKHRHQYDESMRSLQRCLEINPSFLPAQGQIGDILVRTGQAQKGLQQILETIRAATPNDPTLGYWYLFAAEAELELGHDQAALDWALRADILMPGTPLVQAWLASIYASAGDKPNAARHVAALTKLAPDRTRQFLNQPVSDTRPGGPRILQGLRVALSASPG